MEWFLLSVGRFYEMGGKGIFWTFVCFCLSEGLLYDLADLVFEIEIAKLESVLIHSFVANCSLRCLRDFTIGNMS